MGSLLPGQTVYYWEKESFFPSPSFVAFFRLWIILYSLYHIKNVIEMVFQHLHGICFYAPPFPLTLRVAPDTELAGCPAFGYPANLFCRISGIRPDMWLNS